MDKLKRFFIREKYKKFNKKIFPKTKYTKKIVLVEFNAFNESHVCQSLLANFLAQQHKLSIISYFNYCILSAPLRQTLIQKIKWNFGKWINYKNHGIYRSMGSKKVIRPNIIAKNEIKEKKIAQFIFKKLKNKKDILKIKLENILIGDLIYDTFLKSNQVATIDINDKEFYNTLEDFVHLFYYWKNFFNNNNVHSIIGIHGVYSYGLSLRIAITKKIKAYTIRSNEISKITKRYKFSSTNFLDYPKKFKLLNKPIQKKALKIANKILTNRTSGHGGLSNHLISNISAFHSKQKKRIIKKSNRTKILICTRNVFDATHVFGNLLFSDNFEWLEFLGKLSEKTNYDWYLKTHINFDGKFKLYQPNSNKIIFEIFKKYKKIKILPHDYSHKQIINEKINFILTQHGSVGFEYPFFGIPVINASYNNPQVAYNFNFNPKTKNAYEKLLRNLNSLKNKIKINKREILEFYFMRHLYQDKKWLIDDPENMIKSIGGWDNMMKEEFYEYMMKSLDEQKIKKIHLFFKNFLKSNYQSINIQDTSRIKTL